MSLLLDGPALLGSTGEKGLSDVYGLVPALSWLARIRSPGINSPVSPSFHPFRSATQSFAVSRPYCGSMGRFRDGSNCVGMRQFTRLIFLTIPRNGLSKTRVIRLFSYSLVVASRWREQGRQLSVKISNGRKPCSIS